MSNVSIFGKKWIDLVFEDKNKEYGAYQLRQESPKTTLLAFFFGLLFIGSVSGLGLLLSSFNTNPTPINPKNDDPTLYAVDVIIKPKNPETSRPNTTPFSQPIDVPRVFIPVVTTTVEAQVNVPTNNETNPSNGNPTEGNGTGSITTGTGTSAGGNVGGATPGDGGKPEIASLLDKQPEYPGGIKKFYDYVGTNFDKPEIDDVESISVYVSFVIEKDGSMTDIKVLRNPGYGLDKEAVRVLKSLKTKWKPGIKDGDFVRTQYTLPIKIQMN
jgi:periplasmic protein TonB